jgi:RNase P subunit RPR2
MKEKLSKTEAKKEIEEFFDNIKNKTPKQIKKVKKLAMKHSIKLGNLRKKFCKKCYSPDLKVKSIKNKFKTTECKNCGYISRWKI